MGGPGKSAKGKGKKGKNKNTGNAYMNGDLDREDNSEAASEVVPDNESESPDAPVYTYTYADKGKGAGRPYRKEDWDPPPPLSTWNMQRDWKEYRRRLMVWRLNTDLPLSRQGGKFLAQLSGQAAQAVEHVPLDSLRNEDGFDILLKELDRAGNYLSDNELTADVEKAFYDTTRNKYKSWLEYTLAMSNAFHNLTTKGYAIPDFVMGAILIRQAGLSDAQAITLTSMTDGKKGFAVVRDAMRRWDVRSNKPHARDGYEGDYQEYDANGNYIGTTDGEDEYIFEEDDENDIYDEEEVMELLGGAVMAGYLDHRKELQKVKLARGWSSPPRDVANGPRLRVKGKGKGKGKSRTLSEIKARSRCSNCGRLGHWHAECTNPPDERAKQRAAARAATTTSPASNHAQTPAPATSSKPPASSGAYQSFFVGVSAPGGPVPSN